MHILDICMNSIRANATVIEIIINEDVSKGWLNISIIDNGDGMSQAMLDHVTDPFYTTRTTRHIGLGIPLLKSSCERCDGTFTIQSEEEKGTTLEATFKYDHIDRPPMGDLRETFITLVTIEPERDFVYKHIGKRIISVDTRVMRTILDGIPLNNPMVIDWLKKELDDYN